MTTHPNLKIPVGTRALIMSKLYYGVLSKSLENLDIDRYYAIVHFISEHNGCRQQQVCDSLAIDKTAMVKVMDTLIDAGYVEKKVNPDDRREHFIYLTRKGTRHSQKIAQAFDAVDEEIYKGLSRQELDTFNKVMHKLSAKLEQLPMNDLFFNYKKTAKPLKRTTKPK